MSDGFLTIDDVTLGDWAGQLSVCTEGYEFRADVAPIGARLGEAGIQPGEHGVWLVPKGGFGRRKPVMSRRALRNLHERFAQIAQYEGQTRTKQMLRFAGQWGLLEDWSDKLRRRTRSELVVPVNPGGGDARSPLLPGELLTTWDDRINMVAAWLKWWRTLQRDPNQLKPHILWDDRTESLRFYFAFDGQRLSTDRGFAQRCYRTPTLRGDDGGIMWDVIADARTPAGQQTLRLYPELRGERFNVPRAARLVLYRQIETQLEGNIRVGLDMQPEPARALVSYPTGLWGAIWLHFAREVMGKGGAWQRCANPLCEGSFAPRPNKKFCSDACRITVHRQEKRMARPKIFS